MSKVNVGGEGMRSTERSSSYFCLLFICLCDTVGGSKQPSRAAHFNMQMKHGLAVRKQYESSFVESSSAPARITTDRSLFTWLVTIINFLNSKWPCFFSRAGARYWKQPPRRTPRPMASVASGRPGQYCSSRGRWSRAWDEYTTDIARPA